MTLVYYDTIISQGIRYLGSCRIFSIHRIYRNPPGVAAPVKQTESCRISLATRSATSTKLCGSIKKRPLQIQKRHGLCILCSTLTLYILNPEPRPLNSGHRGLSCSFLSPVYSLTGNAGLKSIWENAYSSGDNLDEHAADPCGLPHDLVIVR